MLVCIHVHIGVVYNEQAIPSQFQIYNHRLDSDRKWETLLILNGGIILMLPSNTHMAEPSLSAAGSARHPLMGKESNQSPLVS